MFRSYYSNLVKFKEAMYHNSNGSIHFDLAKIHFKTSLYVKD